MQTPAAALLEILTGSPGVAALVARRVYVVRIPQGATHPCILVLPVTGRSEEAIDRVGGQNAYRVSIEARAMSSLEADRLGAAICVALDNFTGTAAGVEIDRIRRISEAFLDVEQTQTFRRVIDFNVFYA